MALNPPGHHPYAHRPGCPLCGIVATPFPRSDLGGGMGGGRSSVYGSQGQFAPIRRDSDESSLHSAGGAIPAMPTSSSSSSQSSSTSTILYKDANVTAYVEKKFPISTKGHIIIVLNLHVPNIYSLAPSDLPLLNHIHQVATRLLHSLNPPAQPSSPAPGPRSIAEEAVANRVPLANANGNGNEDFHIGFISPPWKDNKIPITDHLHAHCYVGKPDLAGWWRGVAYGPLAWYSIQDLIAEIRETTSNNRVKSGYTNRQNAPIDAVPSAGAISGGADGEPEQYLPLPLQVNKSHQSPAPVNNALGASTTSLLGEQRKASSSSVDFRGGRSGTVPALTISTSATDSQGSDEMESFEQGSSSGHLRAAQSGSKGGSVDLGSGGFGALDDELAIEDSSHHLSSPPDSAFAGPLDSAGGSKYGHRPRESFDEAGWEGNDGSVSAYEGQEGEAGPGPSSIRAISAAARS